MSLENEVGFNEPEQVKKPADEKEKNDPILEETEPLDFPKETEPAPEIPPKPHKSIFERAKEWIKNTIDKVVSTIKEHIPSRQEGGFLDRLEVRAFGGKEAYNKLYVESEKDVSNEELVHREENSISNISEKLTEEKAKDEKPEVDDTGYSVTASNGNAVTLQELKGIKNDTTLVSFAVFTPDKNGLLSTVTNDRQITAESAENVAKNIETIGKLANSLEERANSNQTLRGKSYENKSKEGGTSQTEKFKLQNATFSVTHTVNSEGKHNLSAYSSEKTVSFSVRGANSFEEAVSTFKGLVVSSEEVIKNIQKEISDKENPEVEEEKGTQDYQTEQNTPADDNEQNIDNNAVEDEIPDDAPAETTSPDEPVVSEYDIGDKTVTYDAGEEPFAFIDEEEDEKSVQPSNDYIISTSEDTPEDEPFFEEEPINSITETEANADEPVDEPLPEEPTVAEPTNDATAPDNEAQKHDVQPEPAPAQPPLKAISKELDVSDLSRGDIISKNNHFYIVTAITEKTQEVKIAKVDFDEKAQTWSPAQNSKVQGVAFDSIPSFDFSHKGQKAEIQKGDEFVTFDGKEGIYTGSKMVVLKNGEKIPMIPELVQKKEPLVEREVEEKNNMTDDKPSPQEDTHTNQNVPQEQVTFDSDTEKAPEFSQPERTFNIGDRVTNKTTGEIFIVTDSRDDVFKVVPTTSMSDELRPDPNEEPLDASPSDFEAVSTEQEIEEQSYDID